ncbi:hypothetical protein QUF90_21170 [Desulfococcaceae bacterium HSG9]|nr:hypothetical protein [Desulfococcaceae bacterium HSG9]
MENRPGILWGGSEVTEEWMVEMKNLLYGGHIKVLLSQLREKLKQLSKRAEREKGKRVILSEVIKYMEPRLDMMNYKQYIEEDQPTASRIVEGAARYVIGERMDCSGMRWVPERAEAPLHLRCLELNGDWDRFFDWAYKDWRDKLLKEEKVIVRTDEPMKLLKAV